MIAQDTSTYKLIKRVKDTKFTIDELDHYSLIMQVGIYDLQFAVVDSQDNVVMGLEDYRLEGIKTVNGRLRLIKEILDNHEYLTAGFWKDVKLCLKSHKFSLVPANMFVQEAAADYLALNSEIKTAFEEVNYYKQIAVDSVNVFAAETKLCRWIESIYKKKKVHIIHQGSALIEGFLKHADHIQDKSMYAYVDRGILHIVATEGNRLLYYNQFAARKKEDYLRTVFIISKRLIEFGEMGLLHTLFLTAFTTSSLFHFLFVS